MDGFDSKSTLRVLVTTNRFDVVDSYGVKMENPAVDQLPEAHSLPDGFVDSSVEPLAPSTPMLEQEMPLTDYKEEKLVEPDSSPDLVVGELQSSEEKTEKSENSRTFPVTLTENDASDPLPELGEVDGCVEDVVRESGEQLAGSSCGKLQDQKKCHSSEKESFDVGRVDAKMGSHGEKDTNLEVMGRVESTDDNTHQRWPLATSGMELLVHRDLMDDGIGSRVLSDGGTDFQLVDSDSEEGKIHLDTEGSGGAA
ncbi:hypothetical protein TEA_015083 [Camellia sinensis var. sinensis]|uniref:Uncharacterized protein n=1 Tax=Camellia sinensis var. sinensis TaxID=542762 RepID=A0A4S4DZS9_CAMSN|nr:hypothetical protein TEA_015083 [Camellia sinensis var. sinensis]